jgi:uncharacterized metal-binding protein YceD (DUF177 family)
MKKLHDFLIPFAGLKLGKHQFEFQVDQKFFDAFDYHEFENSKIKVNIILEKKSTMVEVSLKHQGTVTVPCDLTGELFDLPIKGKCKLVVQFGELFNNDNEELLILPHGEHQVDLSQYVYEMIALSVPSKRVHPGVADGTLQNEALERLQSLSVNLKQDQENKPDTDPRWDKLKQLLTDK